MKKYSICLALLVTLTSALFAQNEISQKRDLLGQKQNLLYITEQKISAARAGYATVKEALTTAERNQKDKQFDYTNKKNAFDRASKNVDLVSNEKINELSNEYKLADSELRQANDHLQQAKLKEQEASQKLDQASSEKTQVEKDILSLNADIFDIQLREPVWAIGEATCNLAEDETPDSCRKRALEAAQRDAMEKAGKMILESETIVRNYQLYLDEIRTHLKAQIMEQDNDPSYGIKREVLGDNIRYVAKLRLKVQSVSLFNPYRMQLVEAAQKITNEQPLDTLEGAIPKSSEEKSRETFEERLQKIKNSREQPPPDFVLFDKEPQVITRAEPVYPEAARKAGIEGVVWVKFWVDLQGKVRDVKIINSPSDILALSAIEAAKHWRFTPALLKDGKPVSVWISLSFNFKLN